MANLLKKPKTLIAGGAAAATFLAGCGGGGVHSQTSRESGRTEVTAGVALGGGSFDALQNALTPSRNNRINTVVQTFGAIVLSQSEAASSSWGSFDAWCTDGFETQNSENSGWTSQGYTPTEGQNCDLQDPPVNPGAGTSVSADVEVGADGNYTGQFSGVTLISPGCDVSVTWNQVSKYWNTNVDNPTSQNIAFAESQTQANLIDNMVVNCLTHVRP